MPRHVANVEGPGILIIILICAVAATAVVELYIQWRRSRVLKSRIRFVHEERERLRSARKSGMQQPESRLREKAGNSISRRLVDVLHLRLVFEPDTSREMLRQAGLRRESHLFSYLAARMIVPPLLAFVVFAYASSLLAPSMPLSMRIAITMGAVLAGLYLPVLLVRLLIQRRRRSIAKAWSDALDLMLICVESGMALEPALQRVSREIGSISVPLAEELTLTSAELSYLPERRKALDNLAKRTGLAMVKAVVTILIQSERYGTPLGASLRVLAQENREDRLAELERRAAALPPKLTVPMIIFFLPGIFIILLGPAGMNLLSLM